MPEVGISLVDRYAFPPATIEATSLRHVAKGLDDLREWAADQRPIVQRVVYASGDLTLAPHIRLHPRAVADGVAALRAGCPILVDVRMVSVGIDQARLASLGCSLYCAMDRVRAEGKESLTGHSTSLPANDVGPASGFGPRGDTERPHGLPRAVIGMRAAAPELRGGVVVIGTAPTALLALLDLVDAGKVKPALIIGTPVGFTSAAESKAELMARDIPYVTVEGTRGGAALAAAAANALLRLAADAPPAVQWGAANG